MTALFLTLAEMSLSASWIVLAVIAARLVLKKAPRWMICGLWALVALRLLCPFSLESALSLIPDLDFSKQIVSSAEESSAGEILALHSHSTEIVPEGETGRMEGYGVISSSDGDILVVKDLEKPVTPPDWYHMFSILWLVGMVLMVVYAVFSYLRIRRKVRIAIELGNGVYICDYIDTPFILGILKPKIYLSSAMDPRDAAYVLAHERAHLKRKDHWWKPLGFVLLCIHWFNPLLWVAFVLLCRDIELACDERVIKTMGTPEKKAYSEALLKCSIPRHMIVACPLAFGEVGVKQRVKSVLHYKKPGFWIMLITVIVIIVVAVCFLTDPVETELESPFEKNLWVTELIYNEDGSSLKDAPSELLDTINLSKIAASTIANYYLSVFEEVTLTEDNFDIWLSERGTWYGTSAHKLRKQTVNAWVLHDDYDTIVPYHDFYYLLQTKNGDLYLTSGIYWTAQKKEGRTNIDWICKLEDAVTDRPLTDGDSPFLYTRTLDNRYINNQTHVILTAYEEDGTQRTYESNKHSFVDLLRSIPKDAFSLGPPVQNVEVSAYIDLNSGDNMDVTLRYGDGKVDIVFNENAPWIYADTGSKAWTIRNDDLNDFFYRYSRNYTLPASLQTPQDAYQWCQALDTEHMYFCWFYIYDSQKKDGGYGMGNNAMEEFFSILQDIPASAFTASDFDLSEHEPLTDCVSVYLSWNYSPDTADEDYYNAAIHYYEGSAYLQIRNRTDTVHHAWKIQDEHLIVFLTTYYELIPPYDFRTAEYATGTLSVSHDYANISMDVFDYMEYEMVEYTDDETPFGIRYRPRGVEDGWVFLAFFPDHFLSDAGWKAENYGSIGDRKTYWYYNKTIDGIEYEEVIYYYNQAGDYALLYESSTDLYEYAYELQSYEGWSNHDFATGYLSRDQVSEIAKELLGGSLSTKIQGQTRQVLPTFDYHTGIWIFATAATEDHASVIALQLDAYGNVVS